MSVVCVCEPHVTGARGLKVFVFPYSVVRPRSCDPQQPFLALAREVGLHAAQQSLCVPQTFLFRHNARLVLLASRRPAMPRQSALLLLLLGATRTTLVCLVLHLAFLIAVLWLSALLDRLAYLTVRSFLSQYVTGEGKRA